MKTNTCLIIIFAIYCTVALSSTTRATGNPELKLTEHQKHQIVRQLGFDGIKYIQRLGCETPIATFIKTGKWDDKWCYDNYHQLDYSKIDKHELIFPPVKDKGDSY